LDTNIKLFQLAALTHHSPKALIKEAEVLQQAKHEGAKIDRHWKGVGQSRVTLLAFNATTTEPRPGTFLFDHEGKTTHLHTKFYETARALHDIERYVSTDPAEVRAELIDRSMKAQERDAQTQAHTHSQERGIGRTR
jgi:hypothetical protein